MNSMGKLAWLALGLIVLIACAQGHGAQRGGALADVEDDAGLAADSAVFFYPLREQSEERQMRDRYECYLWAVRQTGFDPSLPDLAPHQRIRVVAIPPPAHEVVQGAVAGAVVGAVIGHPEHTGGGAAIGAAAGALAGAAQAEQVRREVARHEADLEQRRQAELERVAQNYRRAMSACLEGRGYAVQ